MENLDEQEIQPVNSPENDDTLIAIISYFWILWIVAFALYGKKKSEFNLFHLRQGLGLLIISFIFGIIGMFLPSFVGSILNLGLFVFMILGIIDASKKGMKPLPVIGEFIQETLSGIK